MSTVPREAPRLIADIGGTNARFALVPAGGSEPEAEVKLPCAEYSGSAESAEVYLGQEDAAPKIGFCAIANPVTGDWLEMTNHVWAFSIEEARRQLNLGRLRFINDFTAQALAVPHLPTMALRQIGVGASLAGHAMAGLGPGTGLGVSGLIPADEGWIAIEGEGGHATFSPMTPRESALAERLRERYAGHCSAERIVSGLGLTATVEALCELDGEPVTTLDPDEITRRAAAGEPRCCEAVSIFCMALATTAGNLAITLGAFGGVYLSRGIVPKLGALLDADAFRARFEDKGRFRDYLRAIPTYIVTAENPALLGLARNLAWR